MELTEDIQQLLTCSTIRAQFNCGETVLFSAPEICWLQNFQYNFDAFPSPNGLFISPEDFFAEAVTKNSSTVQENGRSLAIWRCAGSSFLYSDFMKLNASTIENHQQYMLVDTYSSMLTKGRNYSTFFKHTLDESAPVILWTWNTLGIRVVAKDFGKISGVREDEERAIEFTSSYLVLPCKNKVNLFILNTAFFKYFNLNLCSREKHAGIFFVQSNK